MLILLYLLLTVQTTDPGIKKIDEQLSNNTTTVSAVLSDPAYMKLHTVSEFREVIKKHAKAAPLKMVTDKEPGIRATIKGKLVNGTSPLRNTLVYVYQTDNKGNYEAGARGDGRAHARLFGYLRTDDKGQFELHTIRPATYPGTTIPQHIHLEAFADNGRSLTITELLFDDDPMLTGEARTEMLKAGFVVANNTGTENKQIFNYVVTVK